MKKLLFLAALLLVASVAGAKKLPPKHDHPLRVVGYIPSWSYGVVDRLDWDALTHINIAFCNPDTLGVMQNPFRSEPEMLSHIISTAHEHDVKVVASLGGGGGGKNYPALIATPESREAFCLKIMEYVDRYGFDGVDLDLEEGPGHVLWNNYEAWVVELGKHCSQNGVLLTTAVSTWFSDDISDATFRCFDFINIMAYDGPFEAHSTVGLADTMARHYHKVRGIEPHNIVVGVPFYGYPSDGGFGDSWGWSDILAADPKAWRGDRSGKFGYNGHRTMRKKCRLAQHYGGIMIWQLDHDVEGEHSLLGVIKKTL